MIHELEFRSVDRALRLKTKVLEALDSLAAEPARGSGHEAPAAEASEPIGKPETKVAGSAGRAASETATADQSSGHDAAEPEVLVRPVYDSVVRAPRRPTEDYIDRPADILSAWTALEVLSPFTFFKPADLVEGDDRRIARFADQLFLPWENGGEKARPSTQLFYHVVLGAIRMEEATTALLNVFVDDDVDRKPERGFAGIATITIDKNGRPIPENAVAISSFAWGLPLALRRQLKSLGDWPAIEPRLVEAVDRHIRKTDAKGAAAPLDAAAIDAAFAFLVEQLELPAKMVDAPGFALRHYHYWKATEPPDPPLLGSFYLSDLAAARSVVAEKRHHNLARYLGLEQPRDWTDLLQDNEALADALEPKRMPLGRWTAKDRHPLVLLQQAAVNLATSNSADTSITPVNGPPGTGKTTLLRDLVAALVVGRAEAMCSFGDPKDAFVFTGEKRRSGAGFTHIYKPYDRLLGFEMLVASSNNKAVENVSRELPMLGAIADDAPNLRYFKTISDNLAEGEQTWGLIAAVLGNSSNRFKFKKGFWDDADRGLRAYLSEAAGQPQFVEEVDPKTQKVLRRRKPEVVEKERPPISHEQALKEWRSAQRAFNNALADARAYRQLLEAARSESGSVAAKAESLRDLDRGRLTAEQAVRSAEQSVSDAETAEAAARLAKEQARRQYADHERTAPNMISRLFGGASARAWSERRAQLERVEAQSSHNHRDAAAILSAASDKRAKAFESQAAAVAKHHEAQAAFEKLKQHSAVLQTRCGARSIDPAFFERSHADRNKTPPWYDAVAHNQRDVVFECALRVHRAFIAAAAKPIRNNLDALFKTFFGRNAWSPRMTPVMPGLWSTLFMVVPVISTTFASIERMIGFLPPGALGWLLVDEAGQAVPQAVVGALMRTKRAVMVGDPLQVQPVTSLPTQLAETICEDFKVNPDKWNAPEGSVQTVADATSSRGTTYRRGGEDIRVGLPLLVHRRCADPMFAISNEIAYGAMMVKATAARQSAIRDVLGSSHWIDVRPAKTEDKWSEAEGQAVIELLRRLGEAGVPKPDLYIISPFRIVAQRLRERIGTSDVLSRWTDKPRDWTRDRVGTVHTVQGREADSVIFVLGAALPTQNGARQWAGGSVNLLNVAATRAKENLYVVGARSSWAEVGHFRALASKVGSP
ncbi:AAA domain-containing protein [Methylopila sp. M107]|uniref:DEAD/DEAH box helicase n=1 Tax=Methylopila sp. M107 TaxID=1101190 RepID=UPI0018CBC8F5|nr:AAA domain-containing protein [Methylopila sp. M107]